MSKKLKYMPILRGRQQELSVLKSFDFGDRIYPCLEIVKELDRLPPKPRKNAKKPSKPKQVKKFEEVYLPIIDKIRAERIFVDLPVHLSPKSGMQDVTLNFLTTVVGNRVKRTEYINKLGIAATKIIPVISTYFARTGEPNSITNQAKDLRPTFAVLAFRTFFESFDRDILQIESVLTKKDYIILDCEETVLNESDSEQQAIIKKLESLNCHVIIHRNPIPRDLTYTSLTHTKVVDKIDNTLLDRYEDFSGSCFSDYSGIKKDNNISKGGTVSPGFIYYDSVKNHFYGYVGKIKDLIEFERTIVPAVISSDASTRMRGHKLGYLGASNVGWRILQRINDKRESGRSPAKFKRIGMEHYLHCIKTRISNGDFD